MRIGLLLAVCALSGAAPRAAAAPNRAPKKVCGATDVAPEDFTARLGEAVLCFEQLEDERATSMLRDLLGSQAPAATVAKAHLYLGLISLNALRTDEAREEFLVALRADALLELPRNSSPKVLAVFREAQVERNKELSEAVTLRPAVEPQVTPLIEAGAVPAEEHRSHALSWVLVGAGVLAIAAGVYGAIDVQSYKSMVPTAASASNPTQPSLESAHSQAAIWAYLWIPLVAAGGLAEGGAVLAW